MWGLQLQYAGGPGKQNVARVLWGVHGVLGLKVTINTDNRTVSNTTLSKELEFIEKTYGIREEELPLMMKNALDVAFADDAVKERIFRQLV